MVFINILYFMKFIDFDPIYKSDLYTENALKTTFFAKKHNLYMLISWIKVYKLHKRKNIDKCHTGISIIRFDTTSNFRKKKLGHPNMSRPLV